MSKQICCEKDVSLLQNDLEKCILWSDNNNQDKFEYMPYQHNRQNYKLDLPFVCEQFQYKVPDTTLLRPVEQLRDLGVTMSSDLSWSPYIYEITGKARQKAAWVLAVNTLQVNGT